MARHVLGVRSATDRHMPLIPLSIPGERELGRREGGQLEVNGKGRPVSSVRCSDDRLVSRGGCLDLEALPRVRLHGQREAPDASRAFIPGLAACFPPGGVHADRCSGWQAMRRFGAKRLSRSRATGVGGRTEAVHHVCRQEHQVLRCGIFRHEPYGRAAVHADSGCLDP